MNEIGALLQNLEDLMSYSGPVAVSCMRGRFWISVPFGNDMRVVPGSGSTDPVESLKYAIARWHRRGPDRAYLDGWE